MFRPLLAVLLLTSTLPAAADADRQLASSLLAVSESRLPEALATVEQLTRSHPNFRLAQLIKGDLLLARAKPLRMLGDTGHATGELDQLRVGLQRG